MNSLKRNYLYYKPGAGVRTALHCYLLSVNQGFWRIIPRRPDPVADLQSYSMLFGFVAAVIFFGAGVFIGLSFLLRGAFASGLSGRPDLPTLGRFHLNLAASILSRTIAAKPQIVPVCSFSPKLTEAAVTTAPMIDARA